MYNTIIPKSNKDSSFKTMEIADKTVWLRIYVLGIHFQWQ